MFKLWINKQHLLVIQYVGMDDWVKEKISLLSVVVKLNPTTWVVDIRNLKLIVHILTKDFPSIKQLRSDGVELLLTKPSLKDRLLNAPEDKLPVQDFPILLDAYRFQKYGINYLYHIKRALLCDDVGLGKTLQSLAAALVAYDNDSDVRNAQQPILIVCPSQLTRKWRKDVYKFTGEYPTTIAARYAKQTTPAYKGRAPLYGGKSKVKIISYDLLRQDTAKFAKFIRPTGVLILDEIQYVKSHMTKRFKTLISAAKYAKYLFGLSATPVERGAIELYNIYRFVDPEIFGDRAAFYKRYIIRGYFDEILGYQNMDELQMQAQPYMLRRHKEDVRGDMPTVVENNYYCELGKVQMQVYEALVEQTKKHLETVSIESIVIEDDEELSEEFKSEEQVSAIQMMHYLRKACLDASLIDPDKTGSAKLDTLVEIIESVGDSRLVVFCFYRDMVEKISEHLTKHGIKNLWLHGGNIGEVSTILDLYEKDNTYKVLVTSDVLKEGHDLLFANYIVNFDIPLSSTVYIQRCGRIDRIGQAKDTVYFINLIAEDTLETDIYNNLIEKMMFSKNIFSPDFKDLRTTVNDIKRYLNKGNDYGKE